MGSRQGWPRVALHHPVLEVAVLGAGGLALGSAWAAHAKCIRKLI